MTLPRAALSVLAALSLASAAAPAMADPAVVQAPPAQAGDQAAPPGQPGVALPPQTGDQRVTGAGDARVGDGREGGGDGPATAQRADQRATGVTAGGPQGDQGTATDTADADPREPDAVPPRTPPEPRTDEPAIQPRE